MNRTVLYKIFEFSSAHRLSSDKLTSEENWDIYDKCNNINGHGHDYYLEVGITGDIDPETGMTIELEEMDIKVNALLQQLNYKHLNKEVPYFKTTISTGENIIQFLWNELDKSFTNQQLYYLKLWETNNNYFELKR
ncbi:MAG: 6-carboxytetrahydropterin synthase [Calditrichia bacterium]|nr:6-carboxytetrahydropterin synthase [Calditrichia bacterium]